MGVDYLDSVELFDAIESDSTINKFKVVAELIQSALTDWPTKGHIEPKDFILTLKAEIKGDLTKENIEQHLKYLNPNFDAWKMESLSSVLEIFDIALINENTNEINLESILIKLTQHYRQKNV